jgi:hypothetical protein
MGHRVVRRPVLERRPADRVVLAVTAVGDVVEDRERAVGIVLGAVLEGVGDPFLGEGLAADEPAAEGLVGEQVVVRVDEAPYLPLGVGSLEGLARDIDLGVRSGPRHRVPPVRLGRGTGRGAERHGHHDEEQRENRDGATPAVWLSSHGHHSRLRSADGAVDEPDRRA